MPSRAVGEDVVDRDEGSEAVPALAREGRLQALAGDVAGVAVAAVDDVAQLDLVEGGVEVADHHPGRAASGRGQRFQRFAPLARCGPGFGVCGWKSMTRTRCPPGSRTSGADGVVAVRAAAAQRQPRVDADARRFGLCGKTTRTPCGSRRPSPAAASLRTKRRASAPGPRAGQGGGGRPGRPAPPGRRCRGGCWPRARSRVSWPAGSTVPSPIARGSDRRGEGEGGERGDRRRGPVAQGDGDAGDEEGGDQREGREGQQRHQVGCRPRGRTRAPAPRPRPGPRPPDQPVATGPRGRHRLSRPGRAGSGCRGRAGSRASPARRRRRRRG